MPSPLASPHHVLPRALCLVVLAVTAAATLYAIWIAISNFSRIGM